MQANRSNLGRTSWLWRAFLVGAVLTSVASVLGLAAGRHWSLLFLDQPRVHYTVFLAIATIVVLARRRWILTGLFAVALVLNLSCLLPVVWPRDPHVQVDTFSTLTALHANVDQAPSPSPSLLEFVRSTGAEILLFQEVTPAFLAAAPAALPEYALVRAEPRSDTRGVAAFVSSGIEVESSEVLHLASAVTERPSVELRIRSAEGSLSILGFHSKRPRDAATMRVQEAEFEDLALWFRANAGHAAIAIGDFNATPWSLRVQRLLGAAGLPAVQDAFSVRPTWPAGPLAFLGLPIDLAVHDAGAHLLGVTVGPAIGSDHLPLAVRIALRRSVAEGR